MHPKALSISDFTYDLPDDRIARFPLAERDQSKLLVYRDSQISETVYASLAEELPENSLLVFNNTKVVEARLLFQKSSGSTIEIFCLEPHEQYADITSAMLEKGKVWWKCLVGGAKKWKEPVLCKEIAGAGIVLSAKKIEQRADYYTIELSWSDAKLSFAELLHSAGALPLPPYLNRVAEESDKERYQTIYARHDGSVAAPTAGLHFTDAVFASLAQKKIDHTFVTLHVGAGTFKPVKSATMEEHDMHAEFIDVPLSVIEKLLQQWPGTIVPVGTTSLRTIESLYWLGVKTILHPDVQPAALYLTQWEPYQLNYENISVSLALQSLINWMQQHQLQKLLTKTQVIIAPGYQLKIAKGLITNFHQPQSTLLLLVAAIVGKDWKRIYRYALEHGFRFLSYGDGCLLTVSPP
jgi:S-adenosylmethionine:tRNA ribosyltransferase-isomerase